MSIEANYIGLDENEQSESGVSHEEPDNVIHEPDSLWNVEDGANEFADPIAHYVTAPDHCESPNLTETTCLESKTCELDTFVRCKPCERMEGEMAETRMKKASSKTELMSEIDGNDFLAIKVPGRTVLTDESSVAKNNWSKPAPNVVTWESVPCLKLAQDMSGVNITTEIREKLFNVFTKVVEKPKEQEDSWPVTSDDRRNNNANLNLVYSEMGEQHGHPRPMVADSGVLFTCTVCNEFQRMIGNRLEMPLSIHPGPGRATERAIYSILQIIKWSYKLNEKYWAISLPATQLVINSGTENTGYIPFFCTQGVRQGP